jgi:hypothetical protein
MKKFMQLQIFATLMFIFSVFFAPQAMAQSAVSAPAVVGAAVAATASPATSAAPEAPQGGQQQPPTPNAPPAEGRKRAPIRVRVLRDGPFGKANDVIELEASKLKAAEAGGDVDSSEAAVEYALSLKA